MRRLVLLASAIVFVDTAFYAVVAPLLPSYVEQFDLSKTGAGVLAAANPLGTLIGAIPSGALAARFGPRRLVLLGLVLMAVSSVVFGFAQNVLLLDAARSVQGIGGACSWAGDDLAAQRGASGAPRGAARHGARRGHRGRTRRPGARRAGRGDLAGLVFSSVVVVAGVLAAWALTTPQNHVRTGRGVGAVGRALRRPDVLRSGLDQGLAFGLVNLAWAVGQVTGSASSGALAQATSDAVPFLAVSALCVVTLAALARPRRPSDVVRSAQDGRVIMRPGGGVSRMLRAA
jgi:MFS family permease